MPKLLLSKAKLEHYSFIFFAVLYLLSPIIPFLHYFSYSVGLIWILLHLLSNFHKQNILTLLSSLIALRLYLFLISIFTLNLFLHNVQSNFLIKETAHAIVVFIIAYKLINDEILRINKILKWVLYIIVIVAFLSIIKWIIIFFDFYQYTQYLFFIPDTYRGSVSVDHNVFALYILFALIILVYQDVYCKNKYINLSFLSILSISLLLTTSRRGIIVLFTILLIDVVLLIIKYFKKEKIHLRSKIRLLFYTFFILSILGLISNISLIVKSDSLKDKINLHLYRYNTLFNQKTNFRDFKKNFWTSRELEKNHFLSNFYYNSNFNSGSENWDVNIKSNNNSIIKHEVISTELGNSLRIHKIRGNNQWSLSYTGRKIYFNKNINYELSFYYRVVKGKGIPFRVGWGVSENNKKMTNLKFNSSPTLYKDWQKCTLNFTFLEDHSDIIGPINGQTEGTIIDIDNVILKYSDTTLKLDPFIKSINFSEKKKANQNYLFRTRSKRLIYTLDMFFKNYSFKEKLFGKGFIYLNKFQQKFAPDKQVDYPHNPILSSFLYSGILGGFFYIYFLFMSFYYYIKNRKTLEVFLYMYLVTFFFMMFSANSHFSVPIFTFLSIIPFIENYKRKELVSNEK